jgi:hypothetical protein
MDIKELYWAAGFLEGEGSFGCWNGGARGKQFVVCAEQVQREPLERLKTLFGGSINQGSTRGGRNRIARWRISGARARGAAMTLFTLMSLRRKEQIKTMLSFPWRAYNKKVI